jgi:SAM-dependent methyltransferase
LPGTVVATSIPPNATLNAATEAGVEERIRGIPVVGRAAVHAFWRTVALVRHPGRFPGSRSYWHRRYEKGGHSGPGSYGRLAAFKAEVLNGFVARNALESVIEFGCGDGNQLRLARYPRYTGVDVSPAAVARCRELFDGDDRKRFMLLDEYAGEQACLAISLDVIYHLVEDAVYERYMRTLFAAARRHVVIYSSDSCDNRGYEGTHIRHRPVSAWVEAHQPAWRLERRIPNRYPYRGNPHTGSFSDFLVYGRADAG